MTNSKTLSLNEEESYVDIRDDEEEEIKLLVNRPRVFKKDFQQA